MPRLAGKLLLLALLALIVLAHVGLWRDPEIPTEVKRRLTTLNALGWAVVLLPAWGVSLWLKARVRGQGEGRLGSGTRRGDGLNPPRSRDTTGEPP